MAMGTELLNSFGSRGDNARRQTSTGSRAGPLGSFAALATGSFPVPGEHDSSQWKLDSPPCSPLRRPISIQEATSFSPEVVEELEKQNPEVLQWLRSTSGMVFQGALVCIYVLANTLSALLSSYVLKPDPLSNLKPLPSSIVVMSSGFSVILGFLITTGVNIVSEGKFPFRAIAKTFTEIFRWRGIRLYILPALCFSLAKVCKKSAFTKLDAGLVEILDQLRLPLTAAMGTLIVGKSYTLFQWLALLVVLLAICSFYSVDAAHAEVTELHTKCHYPPSCFDTSPYDICALRVDGPRIVGTATRGKMHDITTFEVQAVATEWMGLCYIVMHCILVCFGSLLSEKLLKETFSTPFPTQKAQIEITSCPVAIIMSFIVPLLIDNKGGKAIWWTKNEADGSGAGFFQGYTEVTFVIIGLDMFLSWMGGIIVKNFSSLVKSICKCFVLIFTVIFSGTLLKPCEADTLPMTMYALSFIVSAATLLFATMPSDREPNMPAQALQIGPPPIQESFHLEKALSSSSIQLKGETQQALDR